MKTSRADYMREFLRTPYQKARIKETQKRYYSSEHGKRKVRDNQLKRLYGISLADFERMEVAQEGRCAICQEVPKRLVIDHCHSKGHVRKLVCDLCNRAVAVLEDIQLVARVRAYLGEF